MKLTIWQQFSSNHSASFTIVGVFKSPELAQKAAAEIRSILDEVAKWHTEHSEESKSLLEGDYERGRIPATPAEIEIGQRFGVEWNYMVEWFQDRHKVISIYENMVLVQHHHADNPGRPFDKIMATLAEKTFFDSDFADPPAFIYIDLEFTAQSETTAKQLYSKFLLYDCQVKREGEKLSLTNCPRSEIDLPYFIKWLQEQGCSDIKYTLHQK